MQHEPTPERFPLHTLSYSAIQTLETCPRKFYNRYILRLPEATYSFKALVGSAFDETVNFYYTNKKITGRDIPKSLIQDYAECVIENNKEDILRSKDEGISKEETLDLAKFGCTRGIEVFRKVIAPDVEPDGIQVHLAHKIDGHVTFHGYIDTIDRKGVIIDNKTTWRKWSGIQDQWQHIAYSYLANKNNIPLKNTRYDVVVLKKKADPEAMSFSAVVTEQQLEFVQKKIDWAMALVSAGVKNPKMFNYCTSSYLCGNLCPFVSKCEKELQLKLR